MPLQKTITISLPETMGKEMVRLAKSEHRTVSELLREAFRQYQSQAMLKKLAEKGARLAAQKGLNSEDFGGPFVE